jgi:hypothetical protein
MYYNIKFREGMHFFSFQLLFDNINLIKTDAYAAKTHMRQSKRLFCSYQVFLITENQAL